jgi:hypothetical protein
MPNELIVRNDAIDNRVIANPKMMLEIAAGLENGEVVAERYGMTRAEYTALSGSEGYQKQLAALVAEMKLNGVTFARKAAMVAEDLLMNLFVMASNSKSLAEVLEVAKFAAKMGRLEPVATDKGGVAGGGNVFAIQFNFAHQPPKTLTLEGLASGGIPRQIIDDLNAEFGAGLLDDD